MSKRLDILRASLEKKQRLFNDKLQNHFDTVKQANGQPLNDKRNGRATLARWDRQNDHLRRLDKSIRKTQDAIEREKCTIRHVEKTTAELPDSIRALIASGELIQWRKYPNIFFVAGVEKARIGWDERKKVVYHKFYGQIQDEKQRKTFSNVYNTLHKQLNRKKS